jgi:tyrosine-protein phosphatase SIW14
MPIVVDKAKCCRGTSTAIWVLALVVLLGGAAWGWAHYIQTYHLATVQEGVLVRDGNRGLREFETAIRKTGAKTVVSLIDDQELADAKKPQFAKEMEFCRQQGVKVVRIPVKLGGWPTSEDVRRFLDIVQEKQNQPVLVHCAQGVRRTGMMVAAFQESVLGWDDGKARSAMLSFGHSDRTVKDVERFIGVYDAKDRAVTKQLEESKEE